MCVFIYVINIEFKIHINTILAQTSAIFDVSAKILIPIETPNTNQYFICYILGKAFVLV